MLTAEKILNSKTPEELFPNDIAEAKKQFHNLSKAWHPDLNKRSDASIIFQRIVTFYNEALRKIELGTWETPGVISFRIKGSRTGGLHALHYFTKQNFELGTMYVGKGHVTYLIDPVYKDLYLNGCNYVKKYTYGSARMEENMSKCLPGKSIAFETTEGNLGLQIIKNEELLLLRDVVNFYGKSLEPRHLGWILNTVYNIACYLYYANVTHNDISLDTYFISPKHHYGALLGGWWYAKGKHSKLQKLPKRTFNLLPWEVQTKKIALPVTDLELVRAVGREILGGALRDGSVPKPITTWLNGVAKDVASQEYAGWGQILEQSFGPKKFINMDLDDSRLYKSN